ncbi:UNVERIFIED_ORG: hypothetical protein BDK47_11622 [Anoxybacillus amylolyticus]
MYFIFEHQAIQKMKYCPYCGHEILQVSYGDFLGQVECVSCLECQTELEFLILEELLDRYPDSLKKLRSGKSLFE